MSASQNKMASTFQNSFILITFIFVILNLTIIRAAPASTPIKINGTGSVQTVEVPDWNDLGFTLEGDIWRAPRIEGLGQVGGSAVKWENGEIPYDFDDSYPQDARETVEQGIAHFNERIGSCVTLKPRESNDQYFVRIYNGEGCNSYVGRYGRGGQKMNLQVPGCTSQGVVIHEFMHAVGFEHEHQRTDRDKYITVHYNNITPEWRRWWQKEKNMKIIGKFNCKSVMHYPAVNQAYSINGKPAFTAKSGVDCRGAGNRPDFEESDIAVIKKFYGCQ